MKTFPPVFTHAMNQYKKIAAQHGDESEHARIAFTKAMLLAPKWFSDEMSDMAVDMGLIPKPSGYLDNGEPIYDLRDVAKHLDVPFDEAEQSLHKLIAARDSLGMDTMLVNPSTVNRVQ